MIDAPIDDGPVKVLTLYADACDTPVGGLSYDPVLYRDEETKQTSVYIYDTVDMSPITLIFERRTFSDYLGGKVHVFERLS